MENLLKILRFLELALYVVGFIGGVGYAVYSHAYFVAVCVFALGIMALPEAVQAFKHLTK